MSTQGTGARRRSRLTRLRAVAGEHAGLARVWLPGFHLVPQLLQDLPRLPAHLPPQQRARGPRPRPQRQRRPHPHYAAVTGHGVDRPPAHRPGDKGGHSLGRLVFQPPACRVEHRQPFSDYARGYRAEPAGTAGPHRAHTRLAVD